MNSVGKEKSCMEWDAPCRALSLSPSKKKKKRKSLEQGKGVGGEGRGVRSVPHPHGGRQS